MAVARPSALGAAVAGGLTPTAISLEPTRATVEPVAGGMDGGRRVAVKAESGYHGGQLDGGGHRRLQVCLVSDISVNTTAYPQIMTEIACGKNVKGNDRGNAAGRGARLRYSRANEAGGDAGLARSSHMARGGRRQIGRQAPVARVSLVAGFVGRRRWIARCPAGCRATRRQRAAPGRRTPRSRGSRPRPAGRAERGKAIDRRGRARQRASWGRQ